MAPELMDRPDLCYLRADHLEGPMDSFAHLDVRTPDNRAVGRLDGIIIDRPARRMRYFVVDAGDRAHHRYLLPLCPTRLDAEHHALRVDMKDADLERCAEFDPHEFTMLSDEDLRKVIFHQPPADDGERTRK